MKREWHQIQPTLALASLALSLSLAQAQISYQYDNVGRLIAVTDAAGATGVYKYDTVGNILSITSLAAGTLSVLTMTPERAAPGTTITLQGTGFSTTTTKNTLQVNGLQAVVDTATARQLTFKVPASATSGSVTVQVGTKIAQAGTFTVKPVAIATLDGMAAKPNEIITIKATSLPFIDGDQETTVSFNGGSPVMPISVTPSEIKIRAPAQFIDGPLTITSSNAIYKTGTLYAMPIASSSTGASVKAAGQFALDGAAFRATVASQTSTILARLTIKYSDVSILLSSASTGATGSIFVELIDSNGKLYSQYTVDLAAAMSFHIETGQGDGSYTLIARGTQTPSFDLNLSSVSDLSTPITLNGTSNFGPNKPGQYIWFPVSDPGPTRMEFNNVTLTGPADAQSYYATNYCLLCPAQFSIETKGPLQTGSSRYSAVFPEEAIGAHTSYYSPGAYTPVGPKVRIAPLVNSTVTGSLTLRGTLAESKAVGVSPTLFIASFPEQWYTRNFTNTSGNPIGVTVTDVNQPGGSGTGIIYIDANDNGTHSKITSLYDSSYSSITVIEKPGTGLSFVQVRPMPGATSDSLALQLGASLPLTLAAQPITTTGNINANTFAHFTVNPGGKVQVIASGVNFGTSTGQGKISTQRPDNVLASMNVGKGDSALFRFDGTTAQGLHALTIDPPAGASVSAKLRLMTAAPTIADDQLLSFSGAAADDIIVHNFTGVSTTPKSLIVRDLAFSGGSGNGKVFLYAPNGSSTSVSLAAGASWMFGNLGTDGPYTVIVVPPAGGRVSGKVVESAGTALTQGIQVSLSAAAGQAKVLTFSGTAGATPRLALTSLSPIPSTTTPVTVAVFRPDGSQLTSYTLTSNGGLSTTLPTLPMSGTYIVAVFPPNGQALSFQATMN